MSNYITCFHIDVTTYARIISLMVNTLRPRQNGRHFPYDIFKCIFFYENPWISIKISLKFFPRVQLTISQHWFRKWFGAYQSKSHCLNQCLVSLLAHLCVIRPQWVKLIYAIRSSIITRFGEEFECHGQFPKHRILAENCRYLGNPAMCNVMGFPPVS